MRPIPKISTTFHIWCWGILAGILILGVLSPCRSPADPNTEALWRSFFSAILPYSERAAQVTNPRDLSKVWNDMYFGICNLNPKIPGDQSWHDWVLAVHKEKSRLILGLSAEEYETIPYIQFLAKKSGYLEEDWWQLLLQWGSQHLIMSFLRDIEDDSDLIMDLISFSYWGIAQIDFSSGYWIHEFLIQHFQRVSEGEEMDSDDSGTARLFRFHLSNRSALDRIKTAIRTAPESGAKREKVYGSYPMEMVFSEYLRALERYNALVEFRTAELILPADLEAAGINLTAEDQTLQTFSLAFQLNSKSCEPFRRMKSLTEACPSTQEVQEALERTVSAALFSSAQEGLHYFQIQGARQKGCRMGATVVWQRTPGSTGAIRFSFKGPVDLVDPVNHRWDPALAAQYLGSALEVALKSLVGPALN